MSLLARVTTNIGKGDVGRQAIRTYQTIGALDASDFQIPVKFEYIITDYPLLHVERVPSAVGDVGYNDADMGYTPAGQQRCFIDYNGEEGNDYLSEDLKTVYVQFRNIGAGSLIFTVFVRA